MGLPLSILLVNLFYLAKLASKGALSVDVPWVSVDVPWALAVSGALAVIAGSIVGSVVAIFRRSLLAGRILFAYSFIGTFVGSITGFSISFWLTIELISDPASTLSGPSGILGVLILFLFIFLFTWLSALVAGFIWGYIRGMSHAEARKFYAP